VKLTGNLLYGACINLLMLLVTLEILGIRQGPSLININNAAFTVAFFVFYFRLAELKQ